MNPISILKTETISVVPVVEVKPITFRDRVNEISCKFDNIDFNRLFDDDYTKLYIDATTTKLKMNA